MTQNKELKMYGSGNVPRCCFICGKSLQSETIFSRFSSIDGSKIYYTKLYCNPFFSFGHIEYLFDEHGFEIVSRY